MANEHTDFWLALLASERDMDQRVRLWNGYLGWKLPPSVKGKREPSKGGPQVTVSPPNGGWPELTKKEYEKIDTLAGQFGGHPQFGHCYMDFSDQVFPDKIDFSGLQFFDVNFDRTVFHGDVKFSDNTQFYFSASFCNAIFNGRFVCTRSRFDARVYFDSSRFTQFADFMGVEFMGGASFANVTFEGRVMFDDSRFVEKYFAEWIAPMWLVNFRSTKFMGMTSFREVLFGSDETAYSRRVWPERRVDFTDATFKTTTDFRKATFGAAPAFFNAELHEDTSFGRINWSKADTENVPSDYAIRAWERLELIMSKLEKPFDRHQFFRLKMLAKRRSDGFLLKVMNWLFEKTSDYGWGVRQALIWWFGHMVVGALVQAIAAVAVRSWVEIGHWLIIWNSLLLSLANSLAFLRLGSENGYLSGPYETFMKTADQAAWIFNAVGTVQVILGPVMLFLVLLTLRNHFRLA